MKKILTLSLSALLLSSVCIAQGSRMILTANALTLQPLFVSDATERLRVRLSQKFHLYLTRSSAEKADNERQHLLGATVAVQYVDRESMKALEVPKWNVSLAEHADWIIPELRNNAIHYTIDEHNLALFIEENTKKILPAPVDAVVLNVEKSDVIRGQVTGVPKDGYTLDAIAAATIVANALEHGDGHVVVPVQKQEAQIFVSTPRGGYWLQHIATGRSEFSHSPLGRIANVKKAINEKLNGVIIPAGSLFSFNDTLGGAINGSNGWFESLIIVNASEMASAPGGGICQAATTAFRAAVLAGLPIQKRVNHSLYVSHYEDFGVGIDATVFPGKQDLTFENDMAHDIVIVAHTEGDNAFVSFYGVPDGRTVALDGPYFSKTAPSGLLFNNAQLKINEIGWKKTVTYADSKVLESNIVSRYKALPKSLANEYAEPKGVAELVVPSI